MAESIADRVLVLAREPSSDSALRRFADVLSFRRSLGENPPRVITTGETIVGTNLRETPASTVTQPAGSGNSTIATTPLLLTGTPLNDTLTGGAGNDGLIGLGGDDSLSGLAGRDQLIGGAQNDTLDGGADGDLLLGRGGRDSLIGGTGDDTAIGGDQGFVADGGDGNDVIYGGNGNDNLRTGAGADLVEAGPGDDIIETSDLNLVGPGLADTVFAGAGADSIIAIEGSNLIFGGEGADTVLTSGIDSIYADGGDDIIKIASFPEAFAGSDVSSNPQPVTGSFVGGAGVDTLDLTNFVSTAFRLERSAQGGPVSIVDAQSGTTFAIASEFEQVTVATSTGVSTVAISTLVTLPVSTSTIAGEVITVQLAGTGTGTDGADTITILNSGDPARATVDARGGDDQIILSPEIASIPLSSLFGGFSIGPNAIQGGTGTDTLDISGIDGAFMDASFDGQGNIVELRVARVSANQPGDNGGLAPAVIRNDTLATVDGVETIRLRDDATGEIVERSVNELFGPAADPVDPIDDSEQPIGFVSGTDDADELAVIPGQRLEARGGDDTVTVNLPDGLNGLVAQADGGVGNDILDLSAFDLSAITAYSREDGVVVISEINRSSEDMPSAYTRPLVEASNFEQLRAVVDGNETIVSIDEFFGMTNIRDQTDENAVDRWSRPIVVGSDEADTMTTGGSTTTSIDARGGDDLIVQSDPVGLSVDTNGGDGNDTLDLTATPDLTISAYMLNGEPSIRLVDAPTSMVVAYPTNIETFRFVENGVVVEKSVSDLVPIPDVPPPSRDLADYQPFIGRTLDDIGSDIEARTAYGYETRVLYPDSIATADYEPYRLNVYVDRLGGRVTNVQFG